MKSRADLLVMVERAWQLVGRKRRRPAHTEWLLWSERFFHDYGPSAAVNVPMQWQMSREQAVAIASVACWALDYLEHDTPDLLVNPRVT